MSSSWDRAESESLPRQILPDLAFELLEYRQPRFGDLQQRVPLLLLAEEGGR